MAPRHVRRPSYRDKIHLQPSKSSQKLTSCAFSVPRDRNCVTNVLRYTLVFPYDQRGRSRKQTSLVNEQRGLRRTAIWCRGPGIIDAAMALYCCSCQAKIWSLQKKSDLRILDRLAAQIHVHGEDNYLEARQTPETPSIH